MGTNQRNVIGGKFSEMVYQGRLQYPTRVLIRIHYKSNRNTPWLSSVCECAVIHIHSVY